MHCSYCGKELKPEDEINMVCADHIDQIGNRNFCISCGIFAPFRLCCKDCDESTINRHPLNIDITLIEQWFDSIKTTKRKKLNNLIVLAHSKANRNPNIIYECPCDAESKHKHHFDYTRPNDVLLLCTKCHGLEHRRLNRLNQSPSQNLYSSSRNTPAQHRPQVLTGLNRAAAKRKTTANLIPHWPE